MWNCRVSGSIESSSCLNSSLGSSGRETGGFCRAHGPTSEIKQSRRGLNSFQRMREHKGFHKRSFTR